MSIMVMSMKDAIMISLSVKIIVTNNSLVC